MNSETITARWESYASKVLPKDAHPIQLQETRRAFYGGAWAALNMMFCLGEESVSEEQGAERLKSMSQECIAFSELVRMGMA